MSPNEERSTFLRTLTSRHDSFLVWKHLDRALEGRGDIDAATTSAEVAEVAADAIDVGASTLGATHVIQCQHVADKSLLFFAQPAQLPTLFELDLCVQPSRGLSPWASPQSMRQLSLLRTDGIRALRPGAEAVVSIVYHGLSRSGVERLDGDESAIVHRGISTDADGARAACGLLAPKVARRPLQALIGALADGGWDRACARESYAAFLGNSVLHPAFLARRARFRLTLATGRECVMSRIARCESRQVPPTGLATLLMDAHMTGHRITAL